MKIEEKPVVEEGIFKERPSREKMDEIAKQNHLDSWVPKTQVGRDVKSGKVKNIDEILEGGRKILEHEIVDLLLNLDSDLLLVGQEKGNRYPNSIINQQS